MRKTHDRDSSYYHVYLGIGRRADFGEYGAPAVVAEHTMQGWCMGRWIGSLPDGALLVGCLAGTHRVPRCGVSNRSCEMGSARRRWGTFAFAESLVALVWRVRPRGNTLTFDLGRMLEVGHRWMKGEPEPVRKVPARPESSVVGAHVHPTGTTFTMAFFVFVS